MTNAELIKALRWCGGENNEWCVHEEYKCPLWNEDRMVDECKAELMRDAANALEAAEKRIAELEAQMPKEGEWIESEDLESAMKGKVVCSICGEPQFALELTNEFVRMKNQKTNYCPNCGAKMKGENDANN